MRRRVLRSMVSATLLFGGAGCAGLPGSLKEPDVHLDRVTVRGMGLSGGIMDLHVGIYNPNNFDLNGTRLQLGFDVEHSHVGDLEYASGFQMQKGDTAQLTLPVRFNWSGLAGAVRTALGYGDLPYTIKGQLTVQTPFGDRKVPFTREGRAPLSRASGLVPMPTSQ